MLGIAQITERGLVASVLVIAAIAFLGVLAFDLSAFFALLASTVTAMFSAAALAFVLLRHQENAALTTAMAAGVLVVVASVLITRSYMPVLLCTGFVWLSALLVAAVLRTTVSLKLAVLCVVPVTVVAGVLTTIYKPEITHFWQSEMSKALSTLSAAERQELSDQNFEQVSEYFLIQIGSLLVTLTFYAVLGALFIARHWQAQLFNVGGFQQEFHTLRMGKEAVLVFIAAIVLGQVFASSFFQSIAFALLMVFFVQGLSVLHCLTKQRGLSKGWLTGTYIMLMWPPTMVLLSVLGVFDNFFRLRNI